MAQGHPNYWSILTADIRYDKRLKRHADCKVLYSEITALSNKSGYCHATNNYFAELYDRPKETISNWINLLKKYGYLKIEMIYKEGTKQILERRIYPITTPRNSLDNISTPIKADVNTYYDRRQGGIAADVNTPINVDVKDNNININNTSKNIDEEDEEEEHHQSSSSKSIDSFISTHQISLSKYQLQLINKLNQKLNDERLVIYAMKEAMKHNTDSKVELPFSYLIKILSRYVEEHVTYESLRKEKIKSKEPIPGFMTSSESSPKKTSPKELEQLRERLRKRRKRLKEG